MNINGYELKLTCEACPEQYDVFKDGKQVAYLRLRHGWFYAKVPDYSDEIVYEAEPKGGGAFEDDERMKYLTEAISAIEKNKQGGRGMGGTAKIKLRITNTDGIGQNTKTCIIHDNGEETELKNVVSIEILPIVAGQGSIIVKIEFTDVQYDITAEKTTG